MKCGGKMAACLLGRSLYAGAGGSLFLQLQLLLLCMLNDLAAAQSLTENEDQPAEPSDSDVRPNSADHCYSPLIRAFGLSAACATRPHRYRPGPRRGWLHLHCKAEAIRSEGTTENAKVETQVPAHTNHYVWLKQRVAGAAARETLVKTGEQFGVPGIPENVDVSNFATSDGTSNQSIDSVGATSMVGYDILKSRVQTLMGV